MAKGDRLDVEKLTNENWAYWKEVVRASLTSRDLWDVVEPPALAVSGGPPDPADKAKAYALMICSCSSGIVQDVVKQNLQQNPAKLWEYLKGRFERVSSIRRLEAISEWAKMKMELGKAEEYFKKYDDVVYKFSVLNIPMDEELIYLRFVDGLPKELSNTRERLADKKDLLEAREIILKEERRLREETPEPQKAMYSGSRSQRSGGDSRECFNCGKPGHIAKDCDPKRLFCSKCNTKGHTAIKCEQTSRKTSTGAFKPKKAAFSSVDSSSDTEINESAQYYCSFFTGESKRTDWFIDTCASDHFIVDKSHFENLTGMKGTVCSANGNRSKITGRGDATLTCRVGNRQSTIELNNAKHVPEFFANLLSVPRLCEDGYKVLCVGKKAFVTKGDQTVLVGIARNRLFMVNFEGKSVEEVRAEKVNRAMAVTTPEQWHRRFGHPGKTRTELLQEEFPSIDIKYEPTCEECALGKMKQRHYPRSDSRATEPLQLVHTDVCTVNPKGLNGENYFIIFVDDYSKYLQAYPMKHKSDAASCLREFVRRSQAITGKQLKTIRSDCGGEYLGGEFNQYLVDNNIAHQKSVPYAHQQNGVAERMIQKIEQDVRCLLIQSGAPHRFWPEAVKCAAHTENMVPHSVTKEVPYQLFHGKDAPINKLKAFGATAIVWTPHVLRASKLDPTGKKMVFLGYPVDFDAYTVYDPSTRRVIETCNAKINENNFFFKDQQSTRVEGEEQLRVTREEPENTLPPTPPPSSPTNEIEISPPSPPTDDAAIEEPIDDEQEGDQPPLRVVRVNRGVKPNYLKDYVMVAKKDIKVPVSYDEAVNSTEADQWREAMLEEWNSLKEHQTAETVPIKGLNAKPVKGKWVYVLKADTCGKTRFKARYVAKGFSQRPGIDYEETYAPVIDFNTVRIALTIAAERNYILRQFDVKTAYLNAKLDETVYVDMPEGFREPGMTLRLNKALYGLKQASRCWYLHVGKILEDCNLAVSDNDPCLYYNIEREVFVLLYVDDLLIISRRNEEADHIKAMISSKVTLKELPEVTKFCGIEVERKQGAFLISQTGIIDDLIDQYGLKDCREKITTPIQEFKDYATGQVEYNLPVRNLIGSLQYVACRTRPDLTASVNFLSRFMAKPTRALWNAAKNILRYLKATKDVKLHLGPRGSPKEKDGLRVYTDASFGPLPDRKSITGVVIQLYGASVAWCSKKQESTVALSSAEAEYYAMSKGISEGLWAARVVAEFGANLPKFRLMCDSQPAIGMLKNRPSHSTKHVDIRCHFILNNELKELVEVEYVPTSDQKADYLTKPMKPANVKKALERIVGSGGVSWMSPDSPCK